MQKVIKAKVKEIADAEKKFKVEIVTLDVTGDDDSIYFADDFQIEGDFVRFNPKRCLAKLKSYDMTGMELILPNRRVKEIVVRK